MTAAFSAARGFDVPSGMMPVTQLHPREMFFLRRAIGLMAGSAQKPTIPTDRFVLIYVVTGKDPIIDSCQTELELHIKYDSIMNECASKGIPKIDFNEQLTPGVLERLMDPKRSVSFAGARAL